MKKILVLVLAVCVAGCSTAQIPPYVADKNPLKKRFYATFATARPAVEKALQELGWTVAEAVDPLVYEQSETNDLTEQQLLLVTNVRQTPRLLTPRYARLNVFLRSQKNVSEVEIRYLTITSVAVKNFNNYGDAAILGSIMARIEAALGGKILE